MTQPATIPAVATPPSPARAWFLNPYLSLALNVLLIAAAELLLKRGATATAEVAAPAWLSWLGVTALGSWWVWAGVFFYILGFVTWLQALRWLPLSIAFPIAALVQALIPLGAWIFLGESFGAGRWAGVALIMVGIWFIAKPMARAEEEL